MTDIPHTLRDLVSDQPTVEQRLEKAEARLAIVEPLLDEFKKVSTTVGVEYALMLLLHSFGDKVGPEAETMRKESFKKCNEAMLELTKLAARSYEAGK